jgi:hypothetical protein
MGRILELAAYSQIMKNSSGEKSNWLPYLLADGGSSRLRDYALISAMRQQEPAA